MARFVNNTQYVVLFYFLAVNTFYLILFVISLWAILGYVRRMSYRDLQEITRSKLTPPISILIPAYNEAANITSSVHAILQVNYPEYEVIVINDGSTDDTLQKLIQAFGLRETKRIYHQTIPTKKVKGIYAASKATPWAKVLVLDKENGGKADALNAGINVSQYPLFCSVDADSILEKDSLTRVALPFMERFGGTVGVGGIVRVANGCSISHGMVMKVRLSKKWLPRFQVVEYLRAFLSGRIAWSKLNGLLIVSGAFGLFRKDPVIDVKGFDTSTVGEDMELVLRLHRNLRTKERQCRVEFIPDPVCWTEVPEKLKTLWKQRSRWQRGLGQSLFKHSFVFLNPRYKLIGLLAAPYFWAVEFMSPLIELFGYAVLFLAVVFGVAQWAAFGAFFALSVLMGINLSLLAVLLEEFTLHRYPGVRDLLRLLAASVLENLGYRQMINLARLNGMIDLFRRKSHWGTMERKGLEEPVR
ncbi:MAG: glycosyltransferase family 2 protein [Elusimicrobia bacterium]|nr:glycosyltransferase family 2 protein [Elusimicrobiota bacterium]